MTYITSLNRSARDEYITVQWRARLSVLHANPLRPLKRIQGMRFGRELRAVLLAVVVVVLTASCAYPQASGCTPRAEQRQARAALPDASRSATVRPSTAAVTGDDVAAAAHAVSPGVTPGAVVYDRRGGNVLLAHNAARQFRAASVVKLLIAIDTLRRSPTSSASVARMLTYSNNPIASALWVRGGGPAIVRRTADRIGLRDTAPPEIPGRWGNTLLSARDVVAIYRHILTESPTAMRETIVEALSATTRRAADGWDQYFGIPSEIDRPWAIKQGWGTTNRVWVLHSTGLVGEDRRYVVVLLTEHRQPESWSELRRAVNAAARVTAPLVR